MINRPSDPFPQNPLPAPLPIQPVRRPRKRIATALRWITLVVVVVLVTAGGYVAYNYHRFTTGVTHVNALVPTKTDIDGDAQNILLVGDDHRPAGATAQELARIGTTLDGGGTNTDTMIVLHIPADGSKATLISFPRDSWVDIPGFGKNKLNAAFTLGSDAGATVDGARLLIRVIQNMTGLTIDHYVRVSLLGFYNVVKALGPVQVCLTNAVDDPYSTIDLPAGVSTLSAKQALAFVRQRHGLPGGDLDRQVRQQYFLSVEARKILSAGTLLNPTKLQDVLDAVSSSIETDPDLNFIDLASKLKNLGANKISSATIPISGTPTIDVNGTSLSVVKVDTAAMKTFIANLIGKPSAYTAAKAATPSSVTVSVLNGSSTNGAAGAASEALDALGFTTLAPASTDGRTRTTIQYRPGQESQAKALAAHLRGAQVEVSTNVTNVTVVLGTDGTKVTTQAKASTAKPTTGTSYSATSCIR
ncbi:LCP family protein [Glaciihabitans sp. dw_435]|uniref:LCP family protein n=1 Tax=Glaciihabitans sp. dw_435 TaxID=2720081 RepID=UPI001BD625A7|nr:LCP family protein [Glaciihabitans sp. dw_435]